MTFSFNSQGASDDIDNTEDDEGGPSAKIPCLEEHLATKKTLAKKAYPCNRPGCNKSYVHESGWIRHQVYQHGWNATWYHHQYPTNTTTIPTVADPAAATQADETS